jgi:hypothetical protein
LSGQFRVGQSTAGCGAQREREAAEIGQVAHGFKLSVTEPDEGWHAVFIRANRTTGSAAYRFGESALDAARDAQAKLHENLSK